MILLLPLGKKLRSEGSSSKSFAAPTNNNNQTQRKAPNKVTIDLSKPMKSFCLGPQESFYSAMNYTEAKQSFTNSEIANSKSRKTSSDISDESSSSSIAYKPHNANDVRWEEIKVFRLRSGSLELRNFSIFKRLGCSYIGSVHLAELIGTKTLFAMKVMGKEALSSQKKVARAQTEKEILQCLDHPFLPTLYITTTGYSYSPANKSRIVGIEENARKLLCLGCLKRNHMVYVWGNSGL